MSDPRNHKKRGGAPGMPHCWCLCPIPCEDPACLTRCLYVCPQRRSGATAVSVCLTRCLYVCPQRRSGAAAVCQSVSPDVCLSVPSGDPVLLQSVSLSHQMFVCLSPAEIRCYCCQSVSPGVCLSSAEIRCYCSLPACLTTGYMCQSMVGSCFSETVETDQRVHTRHGCLELLSR